MTGLATIARTFSPGIEYKGDMSRTRRILVLLALLSAFGMAFPAMGAAAPDALKPAPVQFGKEVLPILAHRCFECHGNGKRKGDLELTSRELLLKGGKDGPAIVVGKSADSELIKRVSSSDP